MTRLSTNDAQERLADFGTFVREMIELWKVPGLAIGIVQGDEVLFLEGFGLRDVERSQPVTPQTTFALASGTKAFTTMALGLLVDDGLLNWDTPVREYLPLFRLYDQVATERLTPRDLVTHRSGLPRHDLVWYNSSHSREELVRRLRYLEPNKDIRTVWQYQNLMYLTAGYLVEQLSGRTWEEFVTQRIFQPLGMERSTFSAQDMQRFGDFAFPYKEKKGQLTQLPFYEIGATGPAGSIHTCVADMTAWLRLHLNSGVYDGKRLVSEAQVRDMHIPQMVIQRPEKYKELPYISYGLGWFVEPYRGHSFIHHGGNIDGFSTMTTLMPREGIGVVTLCNVSGSPVPWIVCLNAYEHLLGLEQTQWSDRYQADKSELEAGEERGKQQSDEHRVPSTQPSHQLEDYAGEYEHPGYGTLTLTVAGDTLQATLNNTPFSVAHYHYDTFELTWEQWDSRFKATFATDARGDIVSVSAAFEPTVGDIVLTRVADRALRDTHFLARFVGEYEVMGMPLSISLKNEQALAARLPGQPELELVPRRGSEFTIKDLSGFSIAFTTDERGDVTEAVLTQPNGVFHAKKRNIIS